MPSRWYWPAGLDSALPGGWRPQSGVSRAAGRGHSDGERGPHGAPGDAGPITEDCRAWQPTALESGAVLSLGRRCASRANPRAGAGSRWSRASGSTAAWRDLSSAGSRSPGSSRAISCERCARELVDHRGAHRLRRRRARAPVEQRGLAEQRSLGHRDDARAGAAGHDDRDLDRAAREQAQAVAGIVLR